MPLVRECVIARYWTEYRLRPAWQPRQHMRVPETAQPSAVTGNGVESVFVGPGTWITQQRLLFLNPEATVGTERPLRDKDPAKRRTWCALPGEKLCLTGPLCQNTTCLSSVAEVKSTLSQTTISMERPSLVAPPNVTLLLFSTGSASCLAALLIYAVTWSLHRLRRRTERLTLVRLSAKKAL